MRRPYNPDPHSRAPKARKPLELLTPNFRTSVSLVALESAGRLKPTPLSITIDNEMITQEIDMPLSGYERLKRHRARKKAVSSLSIANDNAQTVVDEFTRLNADLKAKLAEAEATGQATAIGQQVLSDPDLRYLVESLWIKSEAQRERFRLQIQSYRGSLKSVR